MRVRHWKQSRLNVRIDRSNHANRRPEGAERRSPPPRSTYGFQKLAVEYFVQGAFEQYKLPYTIVRPFNCVGIGEKRALSDRDGFRPRRGPGGCR